LVGLVALTAIAGCGDENDTSGFGTQPLIEQSSPGQKGSDADTVTPARCPPDLPSCRAAEGRIVYVERVDPDGDGDAHFVILDSQGITLPGLTAIDVGKGLRPDPLPGAGDLVSAAGPVQAGSYGQSQIHALELHVAGH
jgi:hypothetical protein